jgi:hypothetical protein
MKSYNGNSLLFSCWSENSTVVFKVEFDEELLVTIMTELSNVYCKSSKKGPSKFSDTVPVLRSMTQACLQPRSTPYWLVHNSDAYIQQGTNFDALDVHISNKKFSSLVLEFETFENPNKHTQMDEKNKSITWPLNLVSSFYSLKIHHRDRQYGGFPWWRTNIDTMAPDSTRHEYTLTNSVCITSWVKVCSYLNTL